MHCSVQRVEWRMRTDSSSVEIIFWNYDNILLVLKYLQDVNCWYNFTVLYAVQKARFWKLETSKLTTIMTSNSRDKKQQQQTYITCVCVYVHVCMHVCACVHVCVRVCVCVCVYDCMHIYICIDYIFICMFVPKWDANDYFVFQPRSRRAHILLQLCHRREHLGPPVWWILPQHGRRREEKMGSR